MTERDLLLNWEWNLSAQAERHPLSPLYYQDRMWNFDCICYVFFTFRVATPRKFGMTDLGMAILRNVDHPPKANKLKQSANKHKQSAINQWSFQNEQSLWTETVCSQTASLTDRPSAVLKDTALVHPIRCLLITHADHGGVGGTCQPVKLHRMWEREKTEQIHIIKAAPGQEETQERASVNTFSVPFLMMDHEVKINHQWPSHGSLMHFPSAEKTHVGYDLCAQQWGNRVQPCKLYNGAVPETERESLFLNGTVLYLMPLNVLVVTNQMVNTMIINFRVKLR